MRRQPIDMDSKEKALVLMAILTISVAIAGGQIASAAVEDFDSPDEFNAVASNEHITLLYKPSTSEVAVRDNDTGAVWYSNPQDIGSIEKVLTGAAQNRLKAQVGIEYYTPDHIRKTMDNYNDSVLLGQHEETILPDGIRITYRFGKKWKDADYLVELMPADRFGELILSKVESEADRTLIEKNYTPILIRRLQPGETRQNATFADLEVLLQDYTMVSQGQPLTGRNWLDTLQHMLLTMLAYRTDITSVRDMTFEDLAPLIDTPTYLINRRVMAWDRDSLIQIFKEAGFTPEEKSADLEALGLNPLLPNHEVFAVTTEYRIDGRDLLVKIPVDKIEYPIDVELVTGERVTLPLTAINLLEHFHAAGTDQHGYMLVPDGSGALIYLNNGKQLYPSYRQRVYGQDRAIATPVAVYAHTDQIYMPVFGMKRGDSGFLATIEDGDALAVINANVSGKISSYNTVNSSFMLIPLTTLRLDNTESHWMDRYAINLYQSRLPDCDIQVRYMFLHGEDANYVGMARRYREYLIRRAGLKQRTGTDAYPLYVDIIAGIDVNKPVLGFPVRRVIPLTTFAEGGQMLRILTELGIGDVRARLCGWLVGGVRNHFPYNVSLESALGSRRDFQNLLNTARSLGVGLYLDIDILNIWWDKGFSANRDAARSLDRRHAFVYKYNLASSQRLASQRGYILSPYRLSDMVKRVMDQIVKLGADSVSFATLGKYVDSDFRRDPERLVDRQQSLRITKSALEGIRTAAGGGLIVEGGNVYALAYADSVVSAPTGHNGFTIEDESVPFYQIAIHGLIDHAGPPVNLSHDPGAEILKAIETGSALSYTLHYRDSSLVIDTDFHWLYSGRFSDWVDQVVAAQRAVGSALEGVRYEPIADHRKLEEGVYLTRFANGRTVVVNYNHYSVELDEVTVQARGYAVVEEGL
jgi:hypothetical protein